MADGWPPFLGLSSVRSNTLPVSGAPGDLGTSPTSASNQGAGDHTMFSVDLHSALYEAAKAAQRHTEQLVKRAARLVQEADGKGVNGQGQAADYRELLHETEADFIAREAIHCLENCRSYLAIQNTKRSTPLSRGREMVAIPTQNVVRTDNEDSKPAASEPNSRDSSGSQPLPNLNIDLEGMPEQQVGRRIMAEGTSESGPQVVFSKQEKRASSPCVADSEPPRRAASLSEFQFMSNDPFPQNNLPSLSAVSTGAGGTPILKTSISAGDGLDLSRKSLSEKKNVSKSTATTTAELIRSCSVDPKDLRAIRVSLPQSESTTSSDKPKALSNGNQDFFQANGSSVLVGSDLMLPFPDTPTFPQWARADLCSPRNQSTQQEGGRIISQLQAHKKALPAWALNPHRSEEIMGEHEKQGGGDSQIMSGNDVVGDGGDRGDSPQKAPHWAIASSYTQNVGRQISTSSIGTPSQGGLLEQYIQRAKEMCQATQSTGGIGITEVPSEKPGVSQDGETSARSPTLGLNSYHEIFPRNSSVNKPENILQEQRSIGVDGGEEFRQLAILPIVNYPEKPVEMEGVEQGESMGAVTVAKAGQKDASQDRNILGEKRTGTESGGGGTGISPASGSRSSFKRQRVEKTVVVTDVVEDGWNWRKYGQKETMHNSYPRSYYRCKEKCGAKKQVERCSEDPRKVRITYEGQHSHPKPPPRTGSVFGSEEKRLTVTPLPLVMNSAQRSTFPLPSSVNSVLSHEEVRCDVNKNIGINGENAERGDGISPLIPPNVPGLTSNNSPSGTLSVQTNSNSLTPESGFSNSTFDGTPGQGINQNLPTPPNSSAFNGGEGMKRAVNTLFGRSLSSFPAVPNLSSEGKPPLPPLTSPILPLARGFGEIYKPEPRKINDMSRPIVKGTFGDIYRQSLIAMQGPPGRENTTSERGSPESGKGQGSHDGKEVKIDSGGWEGGSPLRGGGGATEDENGGALGKRREDEVESSDMGDEAGSAERGEEGGSAEAGGLRDNVYDQRMEVEDGGMDLNLGMTVGRRSSGGLIRLRQGGGGGGDEDLVLSGIPRVAQHRLRSDFVKACPDDLDGSSPRIIITRKPYKPSSKATSLLDDKISPTFLGCLDSPLCSLSPVVTPANVPST